MSELALAVATRDRFKTWEMKSLHQAARRRNCDISVLDPLNCVLALTRTEIVTRTMQGALPNVVLGRIDLDCLDAGVRLLALLEAADTPVLNKANAFRVGRDKALSALALRAAGIPHPQTWVVPRSVVRALAPRLTYPIVAKPIVGAGGEGVQLIHTERQLLLQRKDRFPLLVQAYCGPVRRDLRVLVLQGDILGTVARTPAPGDWRGNATQGAHVREVATPPHAAKLAQSASQAIGADFAAVDLLETDDATHVLEVNVCPGFQVFSEATGVDVAEHVIGALSALGRTR